MLVNQKILYKQKTSSNALYRQIDRKKIRIKLSSTDNQWTNISNYRVNLVITVTL